MALESYATYDCCFSFFFFLFTFCFRQTLSALNGISVQHSKEKAEQPRITLDVRLNKRPRGVCAKT